MKNDVMVSYKNDSMVRSTHFRLKDPYSLTQNGLKKNS